MEKQSFLEKNKVFLIGLAAAIAVTIQQFLGTVEVNWRVIGYAAGMAALSYIANQWRGQGVTILGIVGTLAGTFVAIHNTGTFTWNQFILSAIAALLAAVAPPPKQKEYEQSPIIIEAKKEGEVIKEVQKAEDKK
jgi:hypothetical protein